MKIEIPNMNPRKEWKIGETEVGYVEHSGKNGVVPYWYPYASRYIGNIRVEAHFWNDGFAASESQAEFKCIWMAAMLNQISEEQTDTIENEKIP